MPLLRPCTTKQINIFQKEKEWHIALFTDSPSFLEWPQSISESHTNACKMVTTAQEVSTVKGILPDSVDVT